MKRREFIGGLGVAAVWPLAANASVCHVARKADRERHAATEQEDPLHLPSANEAIGQAIGTSGNAFAFAEWKLVTEASGKAVWDVEFGRSSFKTISAARRRCADVP